MKRKPNTLLPIELAILGASVDFVRSGEPEFHGYAMAKQLRDVDDDRTLTAHGTLYRALERLEKLGMLSSRWEDPETAAAERRPVRRLYKITATGETAHAEAPTTAPATASRLTGRLASS
jgi:DNA-binding PadR family transcriptional regulator